MNHTQANNSFFYVYSRDYLSIALAHSLIYSQLVIHSLSVSLTLFIAHSSRSLHRSLFLTLSRSLHRSLFLTLSCSLHRSLFLTLYRLLCPTFAYTRSLTCSLYLSFIRSISLSPIHSLSLLLYLSRTHGTSTLTCAALIHPNGHKRKSITRVGTTHLNTNSIEQKRHQFLYIHI